MIRTKKNPKTNCYECISHKPGRDGYPRSRVNGKLDRTHRHVYRKFKGEIPGGMVVRHTCDNRLCCNPDHLVLGTHADNARDRVERGRGASGDRNGASKLHRNEVIRIHYFAEKGFSPVELAKIFEVTPVTIRRIISGKTWKEVGECRRMTSRSRR